MDIPSQFSCQLSVNQLLWLQQFRKTWLLQIDISYAWTLCMTQVVTGDKCQWPEKMMTESDGCNWWCSIFISTTSCFRLGAWKLWDVPKKSKNHFKKIPYSKYIYKTSWGCKLKICYLPISVLFMGWTHNNAIYKIWQLKKKSSTNLQEMAETIYEAGASWKQSFLDNKAAQYI